VPRRRKYEISIESLSDTCPHCVKLIHPAQIARLDFERLRCPHCGQIYNAKPGNAGMTTPTID
jgi:predicted RNA-binding Zn-ribbon protein involved in translation (DUF1610 family)